MAPRKSSKSRRHPPRIGESKVSSGNDESKALAPGSSSSRAILGTGESKESSGTDESEAPPGSTSSHVTLGTCESKESSREDRSKAPGGSRSPRTPPHSGEVKDSSGGDETKALAPGSSSPRTPPHSSNAKDSSDGDESKALSPGSSSPRTPPHSGNAKDSSCGDESKALAPGSSSPCTPLRSGDVQRSSGEEESKASAPGSSSPRPPIPTTDSKKTSGADQSKLPMPGSSSPTPRTPYSDQLSLFGLVVGPDKSNSPPGKGRLINPKLPGTAGPKESQGTDKSKSKLQPKSERARTSKGVSVAESSTKILESNDKQSHASGAADRSIVPPVECSKEDSVVESTSNTPQTSEQSDASPGADKSTVSSARDSPEAASVAESTSKAQPTPDKSFAKSMAEYMTRSASKSGQMTEKYQVSPFASIATGLSKSKPARSRYRDRTTLLADTSVYLPPAYNVLIQMPPRGIYRSESVEQATGEPQSSTGLDEATASIAKDGSKEFTERTDRPNASHDTDVSQTSSVTYKLKDLSTAEGSKTSPDIERVKASPPTDKSSASIVSDETKAPPSTAKSKASSRAEKLPTSPVIDNPKTPSSTTDKPNPPKPTDHYARKWGSKLGSPVIDQSESISAPSTGMKSKLPAGLSASDPITQFGLVVGPDPSYSPTGKGRYIRPVVRPTPGPNESQGTDKSKSKDTEKSKSAKSGGNIEMSKSQGTEKSKSESAVLDGLMGKEDNLAGVPVYISGSMKKPSAIILISDIYGTSSLIFIAYIIMRKVLLLQALIS